MRYEAEYAACNPGWHVEDASDKAAAVMRSISRTGLRPRSVCDIGCGVGEVLAQLHQTLRLDRAVGYDISEYAIALARERETVGLEFRLGDSAVDEESFDLMLMLDVVEHTPDPVAFLRSVVDKAPVAIINIPLELSALKVLSPQSLARGRRALGHLHYFNEALAHEMLSEAGYGVRDAWICPPPSTVLPDPTRRLLRVAQRVATRLYPSVAARTIGGSSLMIVGISPSTK